ncbi:MAG: xylulokinase [Oscillospiraceae bacterium]|jgi:xylulokinase|nr:xylulokinase [Oscillospiraceae bacterium]
MKYLIGIDLGTSGTKTVLFDERGGSVASATVEYPLYQPRNGWAEQDPADWWNACVSSLRQVLESSGVNPGDIAGIGFSGQMHGLVLLDEDGEVLRNSIIWCDGRTSAECAEITEAIGARRLIEISANPALTGFTAGKILWVRKNEPEIYARARHILLPKDYLRYKLTGVFATEVSDASGMNLLDVPRRRWSAEILEKLAIDPALLPSMHESYEVTGYITDEMAALTGLKAGTPVVGGAGDNAAAAIGTGIVESGKAFITIGTSGVIFAHSDNVTIDPKGRVHTFCSAVPGAWTVMSCTLAAGGSLQWFKNNFCEPESEKAAETGQDVYVLLDKMAMEVPAGSNRLLFLPYLMGERSPVLQPEARGVFFGLSGMHKKADLIRAVMEGVVYSQKDCLDVLREMRVPFKEISATGGGGKSPLWRRMMADAFGCPIAVADKAEGPALGAAILAGVGTGVYNSVPEACAELIHVKQRQEPDLANGEIYGRYYNLYKRVYAQLAGQFETLSLL